MSRVSEFSNCHTKHCAGGHFDLTLCDILMGFIHDPSDAVHNLMLATRIGPSNSWGIHGLWPDNCDGTYSSSCDSSRAYDNVTSLIKQYGTTQLLSDMNTYWVSNDQSNEDFWSHEFSKHGTCVTTLDPDCYTNYKTGIEAVDYFQIVVNLFKTLVCTGDPWTNTCHLLQ